MSEFGKSIKDNWTDAAVIGFFATAIAFGTYIVTEGLGPEPNEVDHQAEIVRLSGELPAARTALNESQDKYEVSLDALPHDCQVIISPFVGEGLLKDALKDESVNAVVSPVCGPDNTGVLSELNEMYDEVLVKQDAVDGIEWYIAANLAALGVEPPTTEG